MKKLNRIVNFSPVLGSLVMFIAVYGGIRAASLIWLYQPKAPKCLK